MEQSVYQGPGHGQTPHHRRSQTHQRSEQAGFYATACRHHTQPWWHVYSVGQGWWGLTFLDCNFFSLAIVGAVMDIINCYGQTALSVCYECGRHELATQLMTLSDHCQATSHAYRPIIAKDQYHQYASIVNAHQRKLAMGNASAHTTFDRCDRITEILPKYPAQSVKRVRQTWTKGNGERAHEISFLYYFVTLQLCQSYTAQTISLPHHFTPSCFRESFTSPECGGWMVLVKKHILSDTEDHGDGGGRWACFDWRRLN